MLISAPPPAARPLAPRVLQKSHVTVQQVTNVDWACLVSESLYYETLKLEHLSVTMRK